MQYAIWQPRKLILGYYCHKWLGKNHEKWKNCFVFNIVTLSTSSTLSFNTCHTKKQFLQYYPKLAALLWAVSLLYQQPHTVMKLWTHRNGKMGFSSSIASGLRIVQFLLAFWVGRALCECLRGSTSRTKSTHQLTQKGLSNPRKF